METKHTLGPWFIMRQDKVGQFEISGHPFYKGHHDPLWHCTVTGNSESERLANANLIAAAPELLEALIDAEFLLRKLGQVAGPMQDSLRRCASEARAAIAKATGETK